MHIVEAVPAVKDSLTKATRTTTEVLVPSSDNELIAALLAVARSIRPFDWPPLTSTEAIVSRLSSACCFLLYALMKGSSTLLSRQRSSNVGESVRKRFTGPDETLIFREAAMMECGRTRAAASSRRRRACEKKEEQETGF